MGGSGWANPFAESNWEVISGLVRIPMDSCIRGGCSVSDDKKQSLQDATQQYRQSPTFSEHPGEPGTGLGQAIPCNECNHLQLGSQSPVRGRHLSATISISVVRGTGVTRHIGARVSLANSGCGSKAQVRLHLPAVYPHPLRGLYFLFGGDGRGDTRRALRGSALRQSAI